MVMGWITTIRDQLFETIADHLTSLPQQGRVLDVGTGRVLLPIKIAQRNRLLEVYGVDVSEKAIDAAKKNSLVLKPGGDALIYDHWRNPSAAAKERMRKKYGQLLSFFALLHLKLVSSSLTEDYAQGLLNDPSLKFERKELKQHDIFLLLKLEKAGS